MTESTTAIARVDGDVFNAVRAVAQIERRTLTAQTTMLIEEGIRSIGHGEILDRIKHAPIEGQEELPGFQREAVDE